MSSEIRPNTDSREGFTLEQEMEYMDSARSPRGWESIEADDEEPTTEDLEEMCDYFERLELDELDDEVEYEYDYGYDPSYEGYDGYDEY